VSGAKPATSSRRAARAAFLQASESEAHNADASSPDVWISRALRIDEVPVPEPAPAEILLKVAATGMCRSDYQLLDGYFKTPFPVEFPYIPGHEITGRVGRRHDPLPRDEEAPGRRQARPRRHPHGGLGRWWGG
jgi:hypothetical protein